MDRTADQLLRSPASGQPFTARAAPSPEESFAPSAAPAAVQEVLKDRGQPLDAGARAFLEPRFGLDFSQVRVHADWRAAEAARSVNALAFNVNQDIVFGEGRYAPSTWPGRQLLAHELVHVAQGQGNQIARKADPAAVAKLDAKAITADPDYIENNLTKMEFFGAEEARLYYKDGSTLLIGLVPKWLKPPMKSVDYHTERSEFAVVSDPRELKFVPDARKPRPGKTYADVLAQETQTAHFSVDAGSGKIIPDALNSVTAPFLCSWEWKRMAIR